MLDDRYFFRFGHCVLLFAAHAELSWDIVVGPFAREQTPEKECSLESFRDGPPAARFTSRDVLLPCRSCDQRRPEPAMRMSV